MNSFKRIVKPSIFELISWLYLVVVSVGICYYYVFAQAPEVKQYFDYQQSTPGAVLEQYSQFSNVVNQSEFAADAAVFVVWASVGLLGYIGFEMLMKLIGSSWRLSALFFDKRESKEYLVESTLGAFLMKLLGVTMLLVLAYFFIGIAFPLAVIMIDMIKVLSIEAAIYIVVLALTIAVVVHIFSISMRLILQRERIFFDH